MTSEPKDPLVAAEIDIAEPGSALERLAYATGVLLDADDLTAEQTYHRGRLARALMYLFGSGTVVGLQVTREIRAGEEELVVKPGMAIDGLGRIVEVPAESCLALDRWYAAQTPEDLQHAFIAGEGYDGVVADLFLRFVPAERGHTPAFAEGPFASSDATAASRIREGYELRLVPQTAESIAASSRGEPTSPWTALQLDDPPAERARKMRRAIYAAWRGTGDDLVGALPGSTLVPAAKRTPDSPFWVLLARVVIAASAGTPPTRAADLRVEVRDDTRPFCVTPGALARWLFV
jgi:FAD/FMN-containing dehydrogenase